MPQFKIIRNLSPEDEIYDFTLQWVMKTDDNYAPLIEKFRSKNWCFEEFKEILQARNWFVESMYKLKES